MAEIQIALRETIKSPIDTLSVSIPANAEDKDVLEALGRCCGAIKKIEVAGAHIYWVTGQVLREIRRRKSYKAVASGFKEFLSDFAPEKYGLEKSTAYKMIRFVEIYEGVPIKELLPIPVSALDRASQVIKKSGDMSLAHVRKIVKQSSEMPKSEFLQLHKSEAHGGVGKAVIRIVTTHKFKNQVDRWLGEDPEAMLRKAMEAVPRSDQ